MDELNYHHLLLFYTIAKKGSIAKASKELLLAQPTLSAQLRQLESSLDRQLFKREGRKLTLTNEGRIVLRYAEAIFQIGQELSDDMRDRPISGVHSIQLGVASGVPKAFSHAMLSCILEQDPKARISCQESSLAQILPELREYRLDIILCDSFVASGPHGRFISRRIGKIPVLFAAKPSMARRYSRMPQALNDAPMLLPKDPADIYNQLQVYFSHKNVKPRIIAEVQDVEIARRLAVSGFGIAPLNLYTFSVSKPVGGLRAVGRGQPTGIYQNIYLVTTEDRMRPNPLAMMLFKHFRLPKISLPT